MPMYAENSLKKQQKGRSSEVVGTYFKELGNYGLLNSDEEVAFCKRMDEAGIVYYAHLMSSKYAVSYMRKFLDGFSSQDEIEIHACDLFRETLKDFEENNVSQETGKKFYDAVRTAEPCKIWTYELRSYFMDEDPGSGANLPKSWRIELKKKYDGFATIKRQFVAMNLRLVIAIVKNYRKYTSSLIFEDLIQEGNMGLMKAVEKYDVNRGVKFSTYAVWWIRQQIRRAMSDKEKLIRLPVHMSDDLIKISRYEQIYFAQTGKAIVPQEVADHLGMSEKKVQTALQARSASMLSLDTPVNRDEGAFGGTFVDFIVDQEAESPYEKSHYNELKYNLAKTMETNLSMQEQKIIKWRFGMENQELTLQEIANKYGLSRERIRQLESRALLKLKKAKLKDFSGPA